MRGPLGRFQGHHTCVAEQSPVWCDWFGLVRDLARRQGCQVTHPLSSVVGLLIPICEGTLGQFFSLGTRATANAEEAFYSGLDAGLMRSHHIQIVGDRGSAKSQIGGRLLVQAADVLHILEACLVVLASQIEYPEPNLTL
jgi:hypothetical protein